MTPRTGRCQCDAIEYELTDEPLVLAVCHCTECQRQSGSAFGMSLVVREATLRLTRGQPKIFKRRADSGNEVECAFCPDCGVRLYHRPLAMQGTVNIKPGTLDDRSWLEPALHAWTASKQRWVSIPDGPRFEGQPKFE